MFPQIFRDVFNLCHAVISFRAVEIPGAGGYNSHSAPVVVRFRVAVYAVQAAAILFCPVPAVNDKLSVDLNIQYLVPDIPLLPQRGGAFKPPSPPAIKLIKLIKLIAFLWKSENH